ncbi:DNA-binding domain-containing protein [Roseibium salinum]|uniref:DNA-binding domain-containing protein n=1 Tax=Roseibium salinum TaxID=1604349 RepID=A0ABT3R8D6_9HYPH|nr:DNA-binding domain-containing protein [Roseibium sp. DSM 29163]MCX2725321.1 DNA-binding domain-containing protein [Roseibium sp. DSM 29163]MDN3720827.1 DNA-binding domain-containing protein [Roseibium salinum]
MSARNPSARVGSLEFSRALLDPQAAAPAGLIGPDGKAAPKRFNVYRNNVIVSLCEALGQTFPAIRTLLGEDYFDALARAFAAKHPPASPVLIWYGCEFAAFVECFPPLAAYPYLADVARVEWAWLQAYHAEDAAPLNPAALGAVAPDVVAGIRFNRHPAAAVIASKWPVLDLVRANRFDGGQGGSIDLGTPQAVLVTRPDLDVELRLLRPGGGEFLNTLFEGSSLGEAAAFAQESAGEFSLADCLSDSLSSGAFTAIQ